MRNDLQLWLTLAGFAHFGVLVASALTPRVLQWRTSLQVLTPFLRKLFWVYGVFIFLTIFGFGLLTCSQASALASGSPLARAVCALIGAFWLADQQTGWLAARVTRASASLASLRASCADS